MDPIFAAGLVSLGRNFVDHLSNKRADVSTGAPSFEELLRGQQTGAPSPLTPAQNPMHVRERLIHLEQSLLTTPEVQSFASQSASLTLHVDHQGNCLLHASDGSQLTLPAGSGAQALALEIDQLRTSTAAAAQPSLLAAPQRAWAIAAPVSRVA